jgi:hypothetical protein
MLLITIIFLIAIISAFGMLFFRAWEIREHKNKESTYLRKIIPEIYFRQVEKIMLYLTKHIVQWIVLNAVKYWYIVTTKTKKLISQKLPKIHNYFKRKPNDDGIQKTSFVQRAIVESKIKIRRIKEKVKKDHA